MGLKEIFTDTNSGGLAESFREFLGYFVKQFFPLVNTQVEHMYLARFDYPLLVLPAFLLSITLLYIFWKNPKPKTAVAAAVSAGSLFYLYFHYWVYWTIVIALLFGYTLIFERKNKILIKNFCLLVGICALIALPYFLNYLQFAASGASSHEYTLRLGVAEGRELGLATLGFAYLFYLLLAVITYFIFWKKERMKAVLIWAFLGAATLVWNVQLITGFVPAPNNWRRTISPILFMICAMILYELVQRLIHRFPIIKKWVAIILVVLIALVISKKIVNAWAIWRSPETRIIENYSFSKDIRNSWRWTDYYLGREPKIISDSFMTTMYLDVYTSARPFLPLGNQTPQPNAALEARFLTAQKIFQVAPEIVRQELMSTLPLDCKPAVCPPNSEDNLRKVLWHLYSQYFRQNAINDYLAHPGSVSKEFIDRLVKEYTDTVVDWSAFDGQYIYYGPWEKQFSRPNLDTNKNLKLVYQNPSVKIYKIKFLK